MSTTVERKTLDAGPLDLNVPAYRNVVTFLLNGGIFYFGSDYIVSVVGPESEAIIPLVVGFSLIASLGVILLNLLWVIRHGEFALTQ